MEMALSHKSARRGFQEQFFDRVQVIAELPDLDPVFRHHEGAEELIALLSSGGDARIVLDPATGVNRYLSAPYPRRSLAFASSTANDLSAPAFAHLLALRASGIAAYARHLEALRARILAAYGIARPVAVVFAPSGTDLEFVALAAVAGRGGAGVHNILLGADEVGSGCIFSARGQHFAGETALGVATVPGEAVPGMEDVTLVDVAVRCENGHPRTSAAVAAEVRAEIALARSEGRHALLHVVHGSKTGLILPRLAEIDALRAEFGAAFSVVVDACQARIARGAVDDYLARGAIVLLTGSKFMGGPPFSGFALVPRAMAEQAAPLPEGFARLFRRAEWGAGWRGAERLEDSANPGLALRLEAAVFELERFAALPAVQIEQVIFAFQRAISDLLEQRLGFARIQPLTPGGEDEAAGHPIEMLTLATLDVSAHPLAPSFDAARELHLALARAGLRLGQPVKCLRRPGEGQWGGTLRIGLSMPQVCALAALPDHEREARLFADIERFAAALAVPA